MSLKAKLSLGFLGIVGLLGASVFFGSFETVNESERGIVLRLGSFARVMEPGLNFKLPFAETVTDVSLQEYIVRMDKVESYSYDQQPADMVVSIRYRLNSDPTNLRTFYQTYGGSSLALETRMLKPTMVRELKNVFGTVTAQRAVQDRIKLNEAVFDAIIKNLGDEKNIITVTGFQIENIEFSKAYMDSIEAKQLAEVEVLRLKQNAEREKVQATIKVTQATAEADAVRAKALAESEAIKLRGNAEAEAIAARGKAIKENPGLVELQAVEKWDGKLPTSMIPNTAVPFIGVK